MIRWRDFNLFMGIKLGYNMRYNYINYLTPSNTSSPKISLMNANNDIIDS